MQIGTVKEIHYDREYGYIRTMSGEDAHFHKHCLWDVQFADLKVGQDVEFEIQSSYKGFLAFHIRPYLKSVLI